MDNPDKKSQTRNSGVVPLCMKELHKIFAHLSPVILRKLFSLRPKLREMLSKAKAQYACFRGKMTRGQHPAVTREMSLPLSVISSDIAGPFTKSTRK